ncbi:phosphodiester glycosidase family protein [Paenibacillus kobensis]|uniref:phosphodiester glycosidase family protein n=1 Tax=Paenibacillus kobensis TaxID=59841 RepID=UPI000FD8A4F6|nr:phosphodiester glycosidase family protein [Paenibacillus kobensis]
MKKIRVLWLSTKRTATAVLLLAAIGTGVLGTELEPLGGKLSGLIEWRAFADGEQASKQTVKLTYESAKQTVREGSRVWLGDKLKLSEEVQVTYTAGNPAVVRVEPNGLLTGIAAGKTKVTIKVADADYTGNFTIPVEVAAAPAAAPLKAVAEKVNVSGKTYTVQTVTIPKGTPVTSGIASRAVGKVQPLKDIAANYRADVAVNGTFFSAYEGPADPYGTIISDGEIAHAGNYGTTIGFEADGTAKMDSLRIRILGGTGGKNNGSGNWYAYFINRTPVEGSNSAILYTPKRGARIGFDYGTAVTVKAGVVTKIERNVNVAIPKDGFVVVFTGSEERLADRFTIGNEAHYRIEMSDAAGKPLDWSRVHTAIGAGPRLVKNGAVALDAAAEGFRDDKILTSAGARSGIGIKKDGSIIVATVPGATMKAWAAIMLKLGAYQAMNLDGGASSGLYVNGKTITAEGRTLSNALLFGSKLRY